MDINQLYRVDGRWGHAILRGMLLYCVTNIIVLSGVYAGIEFVPQCWNHPDSTGIHEETSSGYFAAWDGVWYRRIVENGYFYSPGDRSSVAFFPLYPSSCWIIQRLTGLHVEHAMLLTSHLYLVAALTMFVMYTSASGERMTTRTRSNALLVLGLFPSTFYFRMSYTESSFLFVILLAMYGMQRNWRCPWIALIVGLATASRTVGVSLLLPFAWHLWCEDRDLLRFTKRAAWLLPLGCCGLLGYIIYLWQAFGEPFAFVKTQAHWLEMQEKVPLWRSVLAHLTLEPFWQVYNSDCSCYWGNDPPNVTLLSLQFFNPIIMLFTWFVIGYGACRRLITVHEGLLSLGLLAIPYLTHTYRCCGASEARYASVVFPFYIVLGHWLSRCPQAVSSLIYVVLSVYLGICSAMFVSWYWFY